MIVYNNKQTLKHTSACLREIEEKIRRLRTNAPLPHEDATDLLIEFGNLETAVSDVLCRDSRYRRVYPVLRRIGNLTGHIFCCSWEQSSHLCLWTHFLRKDFPRVSELPLPAVLPFRVPENSVSYSLYPETYLEAARKFFREAEPEQVICIGMRSIGTSLSSVVSAVLEKLGCKVTSFTVRPEGHPYHRHVEFGWELGDCLRDMDNPFFVLVDEGPGPGGTSLCGTAEGLSEMGIADDRIVFMPGYRVDGSGFLLESIRRRWLRHRIFTVDFEEVLIRSKRLARSLPDGLLTNISGGVPFPPPRVTLPCSQILP